MKKLLPAFILLLLFSFPMAVAESEAESFEDYLVVTKHSAVIQGQTIEYTATTGTMILETGGQMCELFFIAYTRDDVSDFSTRPISFAFNGGPGSASHFANLLFLGPRKMEIGENGLAMQLPARIIDNENSILDISDLVIIDAISTGYSSGISGDEPFLGYANDNRTFSDFIIQYLNRYSRWSSPKYLIGESYGTTRAVGISRYLYDAYEVAINGVILVSSVNDYISISFDENNELPYVLFLPAFAAEAWYHNRLPEDYQTMSLEAFLEEVKSFASERYLTALFKGRALSSEEKDSVAESLAAYTGLTKTYVLDKNLRINLNDFSTALLQDQHLKIGRYDGRFTGLANSESVDKDEGDPSSFDLVGPLSVAANQYIHEELNFQSDRPYITLSDVDGNWSFGGDGNYLGQEQDICFLMTSNRFFKIWVLCGYYDNATPFYAAEYVYNHVFLDDAHLENLTFSYYPAGHMFYQDATSLTRFHEKAEAWFQN